MPAYTVTELLGGMPEPAGKVKRRRPVSRRYQPESGSQLLTAQLRIFTYSPLTSSPSLPSASHCAHRPIGWPSLGPIPQALEENSPLCAAAAFCDRTL